MIHLGWEAWRWLAVHLSELLGISTQQSRAYDFWSGLGPNVRDWIEVPALAWLWWFHHRCHVTGCRKLGKFPTATGTFKLCALHHPDVPATVTAEHVHRAHALHRLEVNGRRAGGERQDDPHGEQAEADRQ